MADEDFISNYGNLVSLTSNDAMSTQIKNGEYNQYHMNFVCVTDKGEFDIKVSLVFDGEWVYKYEELK